ncbi:MAG: ABC transporter substrate-binding protein [Deltaproteobacteria bacterium]|jgi:NitT/TauT family transport system substrate-binding protein|nr:ABC transporter substrate-binding protein [Deltaproteobacteria bacterium]
MRLPHPAFPRLAGASLAALAAAAASLFLACGPAAAQPPPAPVRLKIGLLPIADTVLLIAAAERGYFAEKGLDVELVSFQSAVEKDAAAIAGSLDGHFCEIISAIVQQASGRDFKVVAATSATSRERRMFGLVTSPGSAGLSLAGLRGKTLLTARQTITDFLADVFFQARGLPADFMERRDVRKIPVRMQLLASDQAEATLVPEPLLTVAESAGGAVLMDDREIGDMPLAVVALSGGLPAEVCARFREALALSVAWVNSDPAAAKLLMTERGLVPPALAESYQLPVFDPAAIPGGLPDTGLYREYVGYLQRIGVLEGGPGGAGLPVPSYADVVRVRGR